MKAIGIIPARYESTRFPRKILHPLAGKPLIQHVYLNAVKAATLERVIVATDHPEIKEAVEVVGGEAVMTRSDHPSGTDRIAEVARGIDCDFVINIQGDEPFLNPKFIDQAVRVLEEDSSVSAATLCYRTTSREVYEDPNVVKAVTDDAGFALYFSRAPIPFFRDSNEITCLKHFGFYGYRKDFLIRFSSMTKSSLEEAEKLEQLRILQSGEKLKVIEIDEDSLGIDTEEDFAKAEAILKGA